MDGIEAERVTGNKRFPSPVEEFSSSVVVQLPRKREEKRGKFKATV